MRKLNRIFLGVIIVTISGAIIIWASHSNLQIKTEIAINAPPEAVWRVLMDTKDYPHGTR